MLGYLENIASKTTVPLRAPLVELYHRLPLEVTQGKNYIRYLNFLKESQYWNNERIHDYQINKLRETCQYASENVPYYSKIFAEAGFNPNAIHDFDDLNNIPYLTKEIIQNNTEMLLSKAIAKEKMQYFTTGGSTGIPLGLFATPSVSVKENAFINHMWKRVGYHHGDKLAVLRGAYIGDSGIIKKRSGQLILSSYHMSEETIPLYIEAIRKFQPAFMHVYPSSIYILCEYMKHHKIEPFKSLRAVLAGSENVYHHQRAIIEEALQCRLFSHYGHCERACLAGECESSNDYHIFWQYGFTELINSFGSTVSKEHEAGEIVVTTFDNFAMPLIRYRTMDIAENALQNCKCGRNYKLIHRINGRLQEVLVTKTGRYISMTAINMHSDVFDHIYQFQFYQDNPEFCIFNVVRRDKFTDEDEKKIYTELKKKLGPELGLKIQYVDTIPKTVSGKYKILNQKLPVVFTEGAYQ